MIGFEAITQNNGWMIAATGACIVFSGLAFLSLIISQLHKLVALLEHPVPIHVEVLVEPQQALPATPDCPNDIAVALKLLQPLINELPPEFELAELYAMAKKYQTPHPHLSIRCLREAGRLEIVADGRFYFRA